MKAAEGDEQELLRLINTATPNQLGFATAYLGQIVSQAYTALVGGDADQGLAMIMSACMEDEDTFDAQARILLSEPDESSE